MLLVIIGLSDNVCGRFFMVYVLGIRLNMFMCWCRFDFSCSVMLWFMFSVSVLGSVCCMFGEGCCYRCIRLISVSLVMLVVSIY